MKSKIHSLASANEWIKYEINDKFSLENIENFAKNKLNMNEIDYSQVKVVSVNMDKINEPIVIIDNKNEFWFNKLQKTIGELLNVQ